MRKNHSALGILATGISAAAIAVAATAGVAAAHGPSFYHLRGDNPAQIRR